MFLCLIFRKAIAVPSAVVGQSSRRKLFEYPPIEQT